MSAPNPPGAPEPAAGWYPDITTPGGERYWDGHAWTDRRRDAEGRVPVSGGPPQPRGASTPVAGWYDDPSMAHTQRYWDGSKWTEHRQMKPPVDARAHTHAQALLGAILIAALAVLVLWLFFG